MDYPRHLSPEEILHALAEYCALQLPEETTGDITVEWDDEDGGVNIYVNCENECEDKSLN